LGFGFWVLGFGLFFMVYFGFGFWSFTQNFGTQNIFENDGHFDQKLYISWGKNIFLNKMFNNLLSILLLIFLKASIT